MKNHWKSLWSALKKSKVALAYDSEFHFGYISKINESSLKSIQNRQMERKCGTYTGILFNPEKERNAHICKKHRQALR
jgi:hypothetical protein